MASIGQRGKFAEGQVKKWGTERSAADQRFWFHRYADARGGFMQPAPADFGLMVDGTGHLLEVKELHDSTRLPYKNFSADKIARMAVFQMAGGKCNVLVCFMPEKEWALIPLYVFQTKIDKASWQLKDYPRTTMKEALASVFGAKPL